MKTSFPLALKIGLWLVANLLLLAAVALTVLWSSGGIGGWMQRGIGDRLRTVADNISTELNAEPSDFGRELLLRGYMRDYDLTFVIFLNDGTQVAGPEVELPEAVYRRLTEGPRHAENRRTAEAGGDRYGDARERPAEDRPPPEERRSRPPPRERDRLGPPPHHRRDGPPPPRRERIDGERPGDGPVATFLGGVEDRPPRGRLGDGRIVERTEDPAQWWMGARVPYQQKPTGPRSPATLFAVSDSALSFGALLDLRPVVWVAAGALFLSVVFWTPLVLRMTRSLRTLMRATGQIAEGDFATRVPTQRRDEIGRLGESINSMAARLQQHVDGQKKFLADVAHELGSPIGRLQVGTAILEDRVPENLRENVGDVREEVEQMSALVAELLEFTRADLKPAETERERVDLADIARKVIAREGEGVRVELDLPPGVTVWGSPTLLARVLGNLVRNAARHGGKEVTVQLRARRADETPRRIVVEVADDGPGVSDEALARLGEPFYRPDAARRRETGGVGLGLSIVKTAVSAMGGEVRFAHNVPRGFLVRLELDAAN